MVDSTNLKPRGPGRPRSERARRAVLEAANELLDQKGFAALSVDAIAERAGVSKATVYRWWPNRAAVVMDAFLAAATPKLRFPDTGSAREDLREQMRTVVDFLSGKTGSTIAALIAEGQHDPALSEAFRSRYLSARRAEARQILERGISRGELRPDLDRDVALDALYGPIYYRLLVGHAPLEAGFADALADHVLSGLVARAAST